MSPEQTGERQKKKYLTKITEDMLFKGDSLSSFTELGSAIHSLRTHEEVLATNSLLKPHLRMTNARIQEFNQEIDDICNRYDINPKRQTHRALYKQVDKIMRRRKERQKAMLDRGQTIYESRKTG